MEFILVMSENNYDYILASMYSLTIKVFLEFFLLSKVRQFIEQYCVNFFNHSR